MPISSLLRRLAGKPPVVTKDNLFPIAANISEECIKDCNACPSYGRAFDKIGIDDRSEVWGAVNQYSTHVIVATGQTDWIRDVVDIPGSVMAGLQEDRELVENGMLISPDIKRVMISASNMPRPNEHDDHPTEPFVDPIMDKISRTVSGKSTKAPSAPPTTVVIVPSFTVVENVTIHNTRALIDQYVNAGPTTEQALPRSNNTSAVSSSRNSLDSPNTSTASSAVRKKKNYTTLKDEGPSEDPAEALSKLSFVEQPQTEIPGQTLNSYPYPHDYLILVCSHRHRDARCGISAPILKKEFEKHLRPLGLWRDLNDQRVGGASVVFVNHVGGHKYAANVIIYRKSDGQGMWLAKVTPQHVLGIIKHTVLEGKIIDKQMLRGGFNRKEGLVSW